VTDASRIGRRQEHTIRSWITQGLLPVNPTRVGINKKTRQVRLSDLAKVTPIVDPDAGIATDLGMLDLPSIPKQQQLLAGQMTALQQEVMDQLEGLDGQLRDLAGKHEQFVEETRQTRQVYQQQYQALTQRNEEHQQQLQQVRDSLLEQMTSYSQELQQTRQNLSTLVTETEQTLLVI
jgi:septal ring factor EnvC (AmiA/AmiB activator)